MPSSSKTAFAPPEAPSDLGSATSSATGSATAPASRDALWTVGELLQWTQQRFSAVGMASPRADAEHLLSFALRCPRISLYVEHDAPVDTDAKDRFRELVRRRLRREPVAYIEGRRGFHALDLDVEVAPGVLIPRPETEHLVDWLLEDLSAAPSPCALLDVGTGSGAIALALAHARPDAVVQGSDVSEDALSIARRNGERLGVAISWTRSDLLVAIDPPVRGFDAIAANLPYVPTSEWEVLEPEVRQWEPRLALDGGPDGLAIVHRLVAEVVEHRALVPGGALYLEIAPTQAEATQQALKARGFDDVAVRKDYSDKPRVVRGRRPIAPVSW